VPAAFPDLMPAEMPGGKPRARRSDEVDED
jgi:hypothetical protein